MAGMDQVTAAERRAEGQGTDPAHGGVLPSQGIRDAIDHRWITSGDRRNPDQEIQPASLDLRLGEHAWVLRCSFLPDVGSTVEEKVQDVAFDKIDLRDGATLERDRPYLVPLV
jgi:dCTP deaminase